MAIAEAQARHMTLAEFVRLPESERMELIHGLAVEKNMAYRERIIQNKVGYFLETAQADHPGGYVAVEGLLRLDPHDPDHGRRPDVAFITFDRLAGRDITAPFLDICPEIVVEVISPHDNAIEVAAKIAEYLAADAKLVWKVQPEVRTVIVHRPDGTANRLTGEDRLSGEDVLPGLDVAVADLFPTIPTSTP